MRQQHCHRDCSCVCDIFHRGICASHWDTEYFWDLHRHLSIKFPAVIATYTLLLSLVSLAFLWCVPGFCAFCSFVIGFFSNSGLQCVVRAWRCSACHSGLNAVHIFYVVACDGSDKILCLRFPIQCFSFNIVIVKFISILYLLTSVFIFAICCVN